MRGKKPKTFSLFSALQSLSSNFLTQLENAFNSPSHSWIFLKLTITITATATTAKASNRSFSKETLTSVLHPFNYTTFGIRSFRQHDAGNSEASSSGDTPNGRYSDELLGNCKTEMSSPESSFLAKLAIALGIAATVTVISVGFKWPPNLGSSLGVPSLVDSSSASVSAAPSVGFSFKVFGYSVVLPEYAPGWIYFWLLMAAGCGLFVSEEALNIWVCPLNWLVYL